MLQQRFADPIRDLPPPHLLGLHTHPLPHPGLQAPPGNFGLDLERYLNALKLQPLALRQQLTIMSQLHDFSSARAHLVMSVPGWHEGSDMHRYGHMGLRSPLKQVWTKVWRCTCTV